ncbi:MAG: hypothetical protein SF339_13225 [Blastocatellia bacterium]|nr:hypothetical protein [Blastocatellia bacterium]
MAFKRLLAAHALLALMAGQSIGLALTGPSRLLQDRPAAAQADLTPEEKKALEARAVALVGQMVSDALSLQLIENRIQVICFAAEMLWKRDEPRARGYLQEATAQFMGMPPLPTEPGPQAVRAWRERGSTRSMILQTISKFDPRMGLDFLRASRQVMAGGAPGGAMEGRSNQDYEKNYEMQLAVQIAENDPQTALQLAEDALKSDLSYQVIEVWRRLMTRDPQAGGKLAGQLISKLRSSDLVKNQNSISIVNEMAHDLRARIQELKNATPPAAGAAGQAQKPAATLAELEPLYKELLGLIASASLKITPANFLDIQEQGFARNLLGYAQAMLPDMEKHLPAKAPLVRAKLNQFQKAFYHTPASSIDDFSEIQKKSAAELMAMAEKAGEGEKEVFYSQAMMKAIQEGDTDLARQISRQHLRAEGQGEFLVREIDRVERERAVKEGKIEEARKGVSQIKNEVERARALISMASQVEAAKDVKLRKQLLDEARGMIGDKMETRAQLDTQLSLAAAYLDIDADYSFATLTASVEKLNAVMAATLVVMRFTQDVPVEEEEMRVGQAGVSEMVAGQWNHLLAAFARKDFARTQAAIEQWQSLPVRLTVNMSLVTELIGEDQEEGRPRFIFERGIQ